MDHFIDVDYPITNAPRAPTPEPEKIAHYASSLIVDGDCIQLGIGGLPDAVAHDLEDRHDLGIYTEMISHLHGQADAVRRCEQLRKKFFFRNRTIGAFCWGSQDLYDYINDNPMVEILPTAYVNNPFNIMKNENMVSLNTALEIDLTGQVCSESIGSRQWSGHRRRHRLRLRRLPRPRRQGHHRHQRHRQGRHHLPDRAPAEARRRGVHLPEHRGLYHHRVRHRQAPGQDHLPAGGRAYQCGRPRVPGRSCARRPGN